MGCGSKTSQMSICIEQVSFAYRSKRVLDNISIKLAPGFNVLLGPNGSGKSTLLSLLTAQRPLQGGAVSFDNIDITEKPRKIMQQLGVVFQQATLDMDLSVLQNLTYFGALHGIKSSIVVQRITPVLTQLDLIDRLHDSVRSLNEGHRRRVEIARCMIHQPRYLLLDEATVGLDVDSRKLIIEHIRNLAKQQQITVLWTTHLMDEVQNDDPLFILHKGALVAQGTCIELMNQYQQSSVFDLYRHLTQAQGLM